MASKSWSLASKWEQLRCGIPDDKAELYANSLKAVPDDGLPSVVYAAIAVGVLAAVCTCYGYYKKAQRWWRTQQGLQLQELTPKIYDINTAHDFRNAGAEHQAVAPGDQAGGSGEGRPSPPYGAAVVGAAAGAQSALVHREVTNAAVI
jgi:hypothetical protein